MKTYLIIFSLLLNSLLTFPQQAPDIVWQKSFGGSNVDEALSIYKTTDDGLLVAGYARSSDGNVSSNQGESDFWIFRIDGNGNLLWQTPAGGSQNDQARSVAPTADGGCIAAGYSYSDDGDITAHHGSTTTADCWIVKFDSTGNIQWQKSLGGTGNDQAACIRQTLDGGYVYAGVASSIDGNVSGFHGFFDFWVVKLYPGGDIQWQKCLGGYLYDEAFSIEQTSDNGFIVGGYSSSTDGDVTGNHGETDFWIVKLNSSGTIEWQKSLGGSFDDQAYSVIPVMDHGYIACGWSRSGDGDVTGHHGNQNYSDVWVVKMDSAGNLQWQKSLGGTGEDRGYNIIQTTDGSYVVCGIENLDDGDVSGGHGYYDFWVTKLDDSGNLLWQKCLGGSNEESAQAVQQAANNDLLIGGFTASTDGDVTNTNGSYEHWIVRLKNSCSPCLTPVNPATTNITSTKAKLNWEINNCALGYRIHYKQSGNTWKTANVGSNIGYKTIKNLLPNTSYTWKVRTKCSTNPVVFSPWSTAVSFNTTLKLAQVEEKGEGTLHIFPNPTSGNMSIEVDNITSIRIVMIQNLVGQILIQKDFSDDINNEVKIDVSTLPAGIYLLTAITSEGKVSRIFMKD
ncbi:MAG TPA: T9SS type A sorting domain-containing protein [Chitinophagales bacterium]|nr:T9SS type A sorting domain-containing protein [Chitinophagales bacterium]